MNKLSKYTKDELPTWDEMYNCFWKQISTDVNSSLLTIGDNDNIDPYWGISRDKVILATCCNQLNKFIEEKGNIDKIKFILINESMSIKDVYEASQSIYEIRKPGQSKGSIFITDPDQPRIVVSEYDDCMLGLYFLPDLDDETENDPPVKGLVMLLTSNDIVVEYGEHNTGDDIVSKIEPFTRYYHNPLSSSSLTSEYISNIMKPVIDYFESKQ